MFRQSSGDVYRDLVMLNGNPNVKGHKKHNLDSPSATEHSIKFVGASLAHDSAQSLCLHTCVMSLQRYARCQDIGSFPSRKVLHPGIHRLLVYSYRGLCIVEIAWVYPFISSISLRNSFNRIDSLQVTHVSASLLHVASAESAAKL
jgi:hypothetical protein